MSKNTVGPVGLITHTKIRASMALTRLQLTKKRHRKRNRQQKLLAVATIFRF